MLILLSVDAVLGVGVGVAVVIEREKVIPKTIFFCQR